MGECVGNLLMLLLPLGHGRVRRDIQNQALWYGFLGCDLWSLDIDHQRYICIIDQLCASQIMMLENEFLENYPTVFATLHHFHSRWYLVTCDAFKELFLHRCENDRGDALHEEYVAKTFTDNGVTLWEVKSAKGGVVYEWIAKRWSVLSNEVSRNEGDGNMIFDRWILGEMKSVNWSPFRYWKFQGMKMANS